MKKLFPSILFLQVLIFLPTQAQNYNFTTLAGTAGVSGRADGMGVGAAFAGPFGTAVDGAGNVYAADPYNDTIRKIASDGTVTTFGQAGLPGSADGPGGPGGTAQFNLPFGVAADGAGNVYVADTWNDTVREITPDGTVSTLAGQVSTPGTLDGTGTGAQFNQPYGIAVDGAGNVYVADRYSNAIRKIAPGGVVTTLATLPGPGSTSGAGNVWPGKNPVILTNPTIAALASHGFGKTYAKINSITAGNPTQLRLLLSGDSLGLLIPKFIYPILCASLGEAGYIGMAGIGDVCYARFGGSATLDPGSVYDFTFSPTGTYVALGASGDYIGFEIGNRTANAYPYNPALTPYSLSTAYHATMDTVKIYYANQPGGGVFKVQTSADNVHYTDVPVLTAISTDNATKTLGIATASIASQKLDTVRAVWVSGGPVAIIAGGAYSTTTPGVIVESLCRGGMLSDNFATQPFTQAMISDFAPDLVTWEGRNDGLGGINQSMTDTEFLYASILPDRAYVGMNEATQDGVGVCAAYDAIVQSHAAGVGALYFDSYTYQQGYAFAFAQGWMTDGTHPDDKFTGICAQNLMREMGFDTMVYGAAGGGKEFNVPFCLAADTSGNVYVADRFDDTIRMITPAGAVTILAGTSGSTGSSDTPALFNEPAGIAVDGAGNVYVADSVNSTIRKITPAGAVTTVGGLAGAIGSADDVAGAARFCLPEGIAVNATGRHLYIADYQNNTIRAGSLVPQILQPPQSQTAGTGQTVVFSVNAAGTGAIFYQWNFNTAPISGATDAYLVLSNVQSADAGSYTCTVTDTAGSVTSNPATLTFSSSTDFGRIINCSIRDNCGTGDSQLIAGFVLGGAGTDGSAKTVLLRGDGPTLAGYGVTGALADPALNVFQPSFSTTAPLYTNTGWNNDPTVASVSAQVGAFALTAGSLDSALVESLTPGSYTANITGGTGDTGIALAEVYDATTSFTATTPRLINVSGRAQVSSGAASLIAGFVIGGSTEKTVLVRGLGPVLANYGVTGALADPQLAVHQLNPDGSDAGVIAANAAWAGDPALSAIFTSVGASPLADPASADCALLVSLPPGVYTANVTSASNATGVALVEVYEVP